MTRFWPSCLVRNRLRGSFRLKIGNKEVLSANAKDAEAGGGVRIYVPGYGDMMPSTSNAFVLAAAMKKHNIKPVYDIWICGTAGAALVCNLPGSSTGALECLEAILGAVPHALDLLAGGRPH